MKTFLIYIFLTTLTACGLQSKKIELPSFNLLLMDSSTILNSSRFPTGKPIFIIYFSPDCNHCQEQTSMLLKNMRQFETVQMYFISFDPLEKLKVFNAYYKLYNYPNITIGRDFEFYYPRFFKIQHTPFITIYDKNKQLGYIFDGGANLQKIVQAAEKLNNS